MIYFVLFLFAICRVLTCSASATNPTPSICVPYCVKAPLVDGVLDDECWRTAAVADNFIVINQQTTNAVSDKTKAWLTYDKAWLYVGIKCVNPDMGRLKQNALDSNGNVCSDDEIEIFINTDSY